MRYLIGISIIISMLFPVSVSASFEPVKTGVQFVEGDDAVNVILSGSSAPCVSRLPAWEMAIGDVTFGRFAARKFGEDCREDLIEAVRDFTDEEKDMLTEYVVLIDSLIDADFPALNSFPWSFAVISDSADFGIPVSRDHIVLSKGLLEEMQKWQETHSNMFFVGVEVLVYEKARLLQARHPEPFERFYSEVWGFRKIREPLFDDKYIQGNGIFFTRVPTNEWLIKVSPRNSREYIMPTLLLRDAGRGDAGTTVQRAAIVFDSTSRGFFPRRSKRMPIEYRDLRQIVQYRRMFTQSDYDYHPAELSADLLAKLLVMKYVSARYGTVPARKSNYSQIDVLMEYVNESGRRDGQGR